MTETEIAAAAVALLVMLVGALGVVVPMLPDVWLIWLAALGYGLVAGFDGWTGAVAMLLITVLAILGVVIDLALGPAAARRGGASWQAITASMALGLLGLFFFPPIGSLVGALLGLFGVEYLRRGQNAEEALAAVKHYVVGCGWSVVARLGLAALMIVIWAAWVWAGRGA
ncbi:MAG: DUF456 domain-containing protein [Anaerolineales bacterium]|nr:DUF456 domain-containing protein [Anaerolineales bacterium]